MKEVVNRFDAGKIDSNDVSNILETLRLQHRSIPTLSSEQESQLDDCLVHRENYMM